MVVDGSNNNFCSVRLIKMLPGDESQPFSSILYNSRGCIFKNYLRSDALIFLRSIGHNLINVKKVV